MTNPAAQPREQEVHAVVDLIPLDRIAESPTNPRKTFNGIEELAESVKQHGILQPILLRPLAGIGSNLLQIVFGARRYRAAMLAKLDTIPAMVRELSDVDALETQIVENSKREDVHPLEEAEGYEVLVHSPDRKYSVEEIAAKVGKSPGYVYGRMKLLALCKEARKAFYDGRFTASTALLIARIPDQGVQKQVLKDLEHYGRDDRAFSLRTVHEVVRQHMCRLADAPFPKDDAELVPAAGPCSTCPKRSGAQPELFADVSKQDGELCTDPKCFEQKKDAAWKRRADEAAAKGQEVLDGKSAAKALEYGSDYEPLDRVCTRDPKYRPLKQLIGKVAKEHLVLARDQHGEVRELVPKKDIGRLLKAAGHDFKAERSSGIRSSRRESAKAKQAREMRHAIGAGVAAAFVEKLKTKGPDLALWKLTALQMARFEGEGVFARRLGDEKKADDWKAKSAHIEALDQTQLQALVFELALDPVLYFEGYDKESKATHERLLAWAGIDARKVEAQVKAARSTAAATALAVEHLGIKSEKKTPKKTGTAAKLAKGAKKGGRCG